MSCDEVPVTLAGRLVAMPWSIKPAIARLCTYLQKSNDPQTGRTVVEQQELYYKADNEIVFPRGLLYRVTEHLKRSGTRVKVVRDLMPLRPVFEPVFDHMEGLEWRHKQFDAVILPGLFDDGVVDAVTAFGKSFIVSQMVMTFPRARFLIITPGVQLSNELMHRIGKTAGYDRLCKLGGGSSQMRSTARLVVSTPESASKVADDWPDVVIFDEVHQAAAESYWGVLMNFNRAKMFGFTGTTHGRHDNAEKRIEAAFGPIRVHVPYLEAVEHRMITPVKLRMIRIPRGVSGEQYKQSVTRYRHSIWRNPHRNERIAQEFCRMAEANPGEQILLMVDKVEHGLYIGQQLLEMGYNVPVVCGKITPQKRAKFKVDGLLDGLQVLDSPKAVGAARKRFTEKEMQFVIGTSAMSTGADFVHLGQIIYCSSLLSRIQQLQTAGRGMRLADGKMLTTVVDFMDLFCPIAKQRSQTRLREAKTTGWKTEVVD